MILASPRSHADDGAPTVCTVITGVRLAPKGPAVHTIEIRGERITVMAEGKSNAPAGDCERVDGAGWVATPGLIEGPSSVGLIELGSEHSTHDVNNRLPTEPAETQIHAAVDTALAFNARSVVIPVTRLEGVTTVVGSPTGGIISGSGFGADLLIGPRAQAVFAPLVALFGHYGPRQESRAGTLHLLRKTFEEAARWPALRSAFGKNGVQGLMTPWFELDALQPFIQGKHALVMTVHRATDIEALLDLVESLDPLMPKPMKLVIEGGGEAWILRDRLAKRGVAVIMDPLLYGPGGFEVLHARRDGAALLEAAGVKVIFAQRDPFMARKLRQLAGNAVRDGMTWEGAMAAITSNVAESFDLADRGSLKTNAIANICLWNGDPLETRTSLKWLMIRGRKIPLVSRQTELFERYRTLPIDRTRATTPNPN